MELTTILGLALVVVTCLFAFFIVRVAGKNVREFDEKKFESFLG